MSTRPRFVASTRFLIVLSLGFHLGALASVMGVGIWGIHHMSRTEDLEFFEGFATIEAAYRLRSLAEQEIIATRGRLLAPTIPRGADTGIFDDYDRTMDLVRTQGLPADQQLVDEVDALGNAYRRYADRVSKLIEAGDLAGAQKLHLGEGRSLKAQWLPRLEELIGRRRGQVDQHHDEVNQTEDTIKRSMALFALILFPIALLLSITTARRVLGPLESLEAASNAMGAGDLKARVPIVHDDEFGHVAKAFNTMAERVDTSVGTLTAANEELLRLDRHKDEFLSIVSHELRTPLNAMKGFAALILNGMTGPISDQQRQYTGNIVQSADRLARLVEDLLDLASLRLEKLKLDRQPTEYRMLVEDVVTTMAPMAAEKRLTLAISGDAEAEPLLDYDRIAQVLTNLVANAIKFTPAGGRIEVAVLQRGGELVTEVRDTGIGVADQDAGKLFQPFTQLDMASTRRAGGTGLGLSISKALVEAHGGRIGLRSAPGLGSTFSFSLPYPSGRPE